METVLNQMKNIYPTMTRSEKKIMSYVSEHTASIINLSVKELSMQTGVGESTIFRFCQKLGYKGYPEFKISLAQDLVITQSLGVNSESTHFKDSIKNTIISEIQHTDSVLEASRIDDAVRIIQQSRRLFTFGIGGSALAAQAAQSRLLRIGIVSDTLTESHEQSILASIVNEEDAIIVFSISGNTQEIIDSIKIAKENRAKIIVITSHTKSKLAEYADLILQTAVKVDFLEGGSLVATISQLYVIDVIVTALVATNMEESLLMRKKTGLSLLGKSFTEPT